MEAADTRRKRACHSLVHISGFYCWGWEFLTALLLFSCSI
ncbi:hypothetical protein BT93_F0604 [Corymbia citriodora subsp. variegata]|nr:hypothetical protein BT93_F0604 [Corymbia citriodora subsp. variegata]